MADDPTVPADGAWRRRARLGLVLVCAVVVAFGIGLAVRSKLYPTPGAMLALDTRSGDQLWRVSTPQADYNEIYWKDKRLILRATGSARQTVATDTATTSR